jgi:hypothetical protein
VVLFLMIGSLILALINAIVMWLLAKGHHFGWVITTFAQGLWIPYCILSDQYGFLIMAIIHIWIGIRGWINIKGRHKEQKKLEETNMKLENVSW